MKTKTIATRGLTMLALAGALAVAAPQAAVAAEFINPCNLSEKIDELQGFGSDKSKNIVVYKATAWGGGHFNDIVTQGTAKAVPCANAFPRNHDYHWVVFKGDGEFTRKGDGGFRNWAFYGSFDRNDNVVKFHRR
ncbi:hypothetical protein [Crossiella cryophila]|uniref:Stress protein n=1 Tax=Crossiella cryophila TaxID=43355 RepID=A0A7W7C9B4_9PSEU|nr:hypothetical protein [Crossiella cryophila]MBB4676947.1 hypothetical protein [Crossiella cryophila]